MDSEFQAALALNLSYVLHEPSTSTEVQHAIEQIKAERQRCIKATKLFARLSEHELAKRVVVLGERGSATTIQPVNLHIVSVRVGAWELLPELLRAAGVTAPNTQAFFSYLDDPGTDSLRRLSFFRGLAQLRVPSRGQTRADTFAFVSAVFRPGYKSILLRFNGLEMDFAHASGEDLHWRTAATLAETTIREFVYQWSCPRALWDRPAEDTLPEFESLGNGTAACGR
jgi:hypothetical protein